MGAMWPNKGRAADTGETATLVNKNGWARAGHIDLPRPHPGHIHKWLLFVA
jgi:hypothetical protein